MENINQPIEIRKYLQAVWAHKKVFAWLWIATAIVSVTVVLLIPRKYESKTILAPEYDYINTQSLRVLAQAAEVDIPIGPTTDAISPDLYPTLVESGEFQYRIAIDSVPNAEGATVNVLDYYSREGKERWENAERLAKHIQCEVDRKTGAISIACRAWNPVTAAAMANKVRELLQEFITEYRTNKARADVDFFRAQVEAKQSEAESARSAYVTYSDSHAGCGLKAVESEKERLSDELNVRQASYKSALVQLQAAENKLQENTPAFTIIQGAGVPSRPCSPKRMLTVLIAMVVATLIGGIYVACKMPE